MDQNNIEKRLKEQIQDYVKSLEKTKTKND